MYVYIWKTPDGVPFYIGFTKNKRRANPRNSGGRNWLCRQKLEEIGAERVVIELRPVSSVDEGAELERKLIAEIGRIQTSTGPLTNLREGGEGVQSPTPEHREKLRQLMLDPNHPVRSEVAKEKARARLNAPDVKAKFLGDANPAKRAEVRAQLKEKWQDPAHRAKVTAARTGLTRKLTEETKQILRDNLTNNAAMKSWGERNGKDAAFDAKRIAGIRAAQDQRREKMSDPEALAKRKARLKETMNSDAYKAKRALWDTPEYRARLSEAKKAYWAKKKARI